VTICRRFFEAEEVLQIIEETTTLSLKKIETLDKKKLSLNQQVTKQKISEGS
jgi:hypothetical protein